MLLAKNILTSLAKSVFISLGLAVSTAVDVGIHKMKFRSGVLLLISNKKIEIYHENS